MVAVGLEFGVGYNPLKQVQEIAAMNAIEQRILEKLSHLEAEQQRRVLDFVEQLATPRLHYTARELMQMPAHERNAIIRAQLERSLDEDFETFEAYSEEDLDATV